MIFNTSPGNPAPVPTSTRLRQLSVLRKRRRAQESTKCLTATPGSSVMEVRLMARFCFEEHALVDAEHLNPRLRQVYSKLTCPFFQAVDELIHSSLLPPRPFCCAISLRCTVRAIKSAGEIPDTRDACPTDSGRTAPRRSRPRATISSTHHNQSPGESAISQAS